MVVNRNGTAKDLSGKTFRGANAGETPDRFDGIGLIVENCKNVVIHGGTFRGFRCAILVRNCENVTIEDIDVSGNFRQRLRSTPEREDGSDWLRPHENDAQQWRKHYGAGICIENSRKCVVRRCVGRDQQNGILLDRCDKCRVYDNDMSFNSGWGLALWRSSQNVVSHNSFDWCVRGYSHGVYDRGQDSAGILVFEQCKYNFFFKNSATHGGDGFFLYAGHETLKKTGDGGCNYNDVVGNDFSHAVANAIEATFSRGNQFLNNRCDDSNYGVWAGYSYETRIEGNTCRNNTYAGIGIEHGMENEILLNRIEGNPKGIWLWWDDDKDLLRGAFAKRHACRSEAYVVVGNVLRRNEVDVFLRDTSRVAFGGKVPGSLRKEGKCGEITGGAEYPREPPPFPPGGVLGSRETALPEGHPRGRRHIMVNEWGPLDPRKPEVYPRHVASADAARFQVVGDRPFRVEGLPAGFKVERAGTGFRVVNRRDGLHRFAAVVVIDKQRFPISGTLFNTTWDVEFRAWTVDPRTDGSTFEGEPGRRETVRRLNYVWGNRGDRFSTRATTHIRLPAGRYEVRTLSDDGVRVTINGKKVQEDWTHHGPTEHKSVVELAAGEHTIVVEHFEITGYAVLGFDMRLLTRPYKRIEKGVIFDYDGKYENDPRLAAVLLKLPKLRKRALAWISLRLGREIPDTFLVRIADSGTDRSGLWAEVRTEDADGKPRSVLVLRTEHLMLGTHDLEKTLRHEFYHCVQRALLGGSGHISTPKWVREGTALYIADQAIDRARTLAAYVGSDNRIKDPLARLVNGLGGRHTLEDYAEDVAAFLAVDHRHGPGKLRALLSMLLDTPDHKSAIREVLGEGFETFEKHAAAHARKLLGPMIEVGRAAVLEARARLRARDYEGALASLTGEGGYGAVSSYYRALALFRLGRHGEALPLVRDEAIARTTLVGNAKLLELRILKALNHGDYAEAARRARLDLEPFVVYPSVLKLLDG